LGGYEKGTELMKFYIASKLENFAQVQSLAGKLKAAGWTHTYDWTVHCSVKERDIETLKKVGEQEYKEEKNADIVVVLTPQGRGTHVELGMAIALNKNIYLCHVDGNYFNCDDNTSAFYWLPQVKQFIGNIDDIAYEIINSHAEMTGDNAVEIIRLLEQNGIEVYVDGGWGVDALLGEQTRKHSDLDIALPHKYVPRLRELLEARGFVDVQRNDTRECNFVLGDNKGHLLDVHSYTFDENGKHIFGVAYEPQHFTGTGVIGGYPVKCIPPDIMVEFHTGYEVDENDYRDVKALCERFNIPMPEIYKGFENLRIG
jgi:lincosamide nucleotidyltransferase A/C/D/E